MMENNPEEPRPFPSPRQAILVVIATFLGLFLLWALGMNDGSKGSLLLYEIFTIVPAVFFLRMRNLPLAVALRLRPVSRRILGVSALIGLALTIVGDELDRLMAMILPLPRELESILTKTLTAETTGDWLILIVAAVVLAALLEEMLFRGFLQNALEERMDVTRAVLSTAFIFSFIHVNPWWMVQIVVLAVFLGVMAWKSNSIFPSVMVHLVNNGIALLTVNLGEARFAFLYWREHVNPLWVLLSLAALFYGMKAFYRFSDEDMEIPSYLNQPL